MPNQWKPISEAPRDGTQFLAWCPDFGLVLMEKRGIINETWELTPSGRMDTPEPTHFMFLPDPPNTEG